MSKILNKEMVNDIDLATSLTPSELKNILTEKKVFYRDRHSSWNNYRCN